MSQWNQYLWFTDCHEYVGALAQNLPDNTYDFVDRRVTRLSSEWATVISRRLHTHTVPRQGNERINQSRVEFAAGFAVRAVLVNSRAPPAQASLLTAARATIRNAREMCSNAAPETKKGLVYLISAWPITTAVVTTLVRGALLLCMPLKFDGSYRECSKTLDKMLNFGMPSTIILCVMHHRNAQSTCS